MVEGEYINQRFASIERKLDTIDTKLDEMRKDRIMCQKECAADVEKIKTEVRALELKHEAALAKQATELGIWRWALGIMMGMTILGFMNFIYHQFDSKIDPVPQKVSYPPIPHP